ncbi:AAA family ATPase [Candidatus Enterococcus leclercqii]|uniref:AAA family ATPase n=1 Tax=Candidatus Enterococcus leclercqii TaxID=1857218 RepID=UPI00137B3D23|nr:AAA family ATPase [Enterococcus sp. CU9D]KAF1292249.1 hypothetical protein BAU14_06905 [Enterococcus sp. CU9D]
MSLIVLIGGQAVGKMTVGKELEKMIDGKLLFNHQTIDLYANFLGYTPETFRLSDQTRKMLFRTFSANTETNLVEHLIFTVMIDFDSRDDRQFLQDIATIFQEEQQEVYFIQLTTDLNTRLTRNQHPDRLAAKPSKRNLAFSRNELLTTAQNYRLSLPAAEFATSFPEIFTLTIDNTELSAVDCAQTIKQHFNLS